VAVAETRSWAEQLCRRWAVRYRSRQHPVTPTSGPQVRRQLLEAQLNVCRRRDSAAADRLSAVLLCWYLARVDLVHTLLVSAVSSVQLRLAVAVLLVSASMLLLAGGVVFSVRLVWSALTVLVHSLLHFALLLVIMLTVTLSTLTLVACLHSAPI